MARYERIPEELKRYTQWVCTYEDSKVPMRAFEREAASSVDSSSWADFETAVSAIESGYYAYCGFVFNYNGIVGIDIDVGYEDGLLSPLAADIIGACESYTEKSKSGRGFHVLVRGNLPFDGKNNLAGVEIYQAKRYFIMTGDVLLYGNIVGNQEAIDYVVRTYFKDTPKKSNCSKKPNSSRIYTPVWEKPNNAIFKVRPTYPPIESGGRNISLTSLAGAMHVQGYTKAQIYKELVYANSIACKPPLDAREIQSICNSIMRYERSGAR